MEGFRKHQHEEKKMRRSCKCKKKIRKDKTLEKMHKQMKKVAQNLKILIFLKIQNKENTLHFQTHPPPYKDPERGVPTSLPPTSGPLATPNP